MRRNGNNIPLFYLCFSFILNIKFAITTKYIINPFNVFCVNFAMFTINFSTYY